MLIANTSIVVVFKQTNYTILIDKKNTYRSELQYVHGTVVRAMVNVCEFNRGGKLLIEKSITVFFFSFVIDPFKTRAARFSIV